MARRLILDTGVLIKTERGAPALASVIGPDDDVVIAALTVAELHAGIELADERYRPRRSEFLARLLDVIPVEPYDLSVVKCTGRCSPTVTARAPDGGLTT